MCMYLHVLLIYTAVPTFNCSTAAQYLTDKYEQLSNLSYPGMHTRLFGNGVITMQEKKEIEQKIGNKQMEAVLDIIIDNLKAGDSTKYKGFLKAMEKSDDKLLNIKAEELAKYVGSHYHYFVMNCC